MMRKHGFILGAVVVAFAGVGMFALAAEDEDAAKVVVKLADEVGKKDWAALSKDGQELAKKHELLDVMTQFKLRRPGVKTTGLGVGATPGKIVPDGIEAKIINMSRVPAPQAKLAAEQADLIELAERVAAVAAISIHQGPEKAQPGGKTPEKWKELTTEMYKSSQELIKQLKANDATEVKNSMNKLNGTCTECHGIFRDS